MLSHAYFRVRLYSVEYWCQDQSPSYRIKHTSRTSTGWLVSAWWHVNDRHLFSVVTGCHRNKNSYCMRRYHPGICLRIADEPTPTATTYTFLNFSPPPYNSVPLPTSPSFSSVPFPSSPHPQHFLPSLSTLCDFLLYQSTCEPALHCKASQPACKYSLFQLAPTQCTQYNQPSSHCFHWGGHIWCLGLWSSCLKMQHVPVWC